VGTCALFLLFRFVPRVRTAPPRKESADPGNVGGIVAVAWSRIG